MPTRARRRRGQSPPPACRVDDDERSSPPPPPPLFGYRYWKCYYAKDAPHFKAAALYSTEVDYFNFGNCRLAGDGKYYCGAMALGSPYKGLASTGEEGDHLGSDSFTNYNPRFDPAISHGNNKFVASDYDKLQHAANPSYYGRGQPEQHHYPMISGRNGQPAAHPTYTNGATTAIFSNGQVRQPVKMAYDRTTGAATIATGHEDHNNEDFSNWAVQPEAGAQLRAGLHLATGHRS